MRSLIPIELTRSAGSKGALVAVSVLLLSAFAMPPAFAQGGGITAPHSSGVPAPDPAPERTPPAPDAAPDADSDSVQAAPSPQTPPPSSAPDTSAPVVPSEPAASQRAAVPRSGQPGPRRSAKSARRNKERAKRKAREQHQLSKVDRPSPASVFGVNPPVAGRIAGDIDSAPPPVALMAVALLTLVVAGAALLALMTQLSRIEGLTPPKRQHAQWLGPILQAARFSHHGAGRRPAS
jgi:hypothetical protein